MSVPAAAENVGELRRVGAAGWFLEAAPTPECPRCGYDLSGLVAVWQESCPLRAACSECGEEFECGRVLGLRAPWWSFEHAERGVVRRWVGTSWRALWPSFWRTVEVDLPVRRGRLALFAMLWLALSLPITHVMVVNIALDVYGAPLLASDVGQWLWLLVWPYGTLLDLAYFVTILSAILFGAALPLLLLAALTPAVTFLFSSIFGAIPGRAHLLLRAAACGLPLTTVAMLLYALFLPPLLSSGTPGLVGLVFLIYIVGPAWLLLWWRAFLKNQLGTRRPGIATFVLLILAFIGTAFISEAIKVLLERVVH